jgi:hypothetical protein
MSPINHAAILPTLIVTAGDAAVTTITMPTHQTHVIAILEPKALLVSIILTVRVSPEQQ